MPAALVSIDFAPLLTRGVAEIDMGSNTSFIAPIGQRITLYHSENNRFHINFLLF
jgi:hypothetical protein